MNKTYALVTGASSGIGEGLMHEFLSNGYNVIAIADDREELENTIERHMRMHENIEIVSMVKDLTSETAAEEIYDAVHEEGLEVEFLVNDAGQGQIGEFATIPIERDIYLIRLNVEALTRLTKLFLPGMLARGHGKILNIGSIAGFQPGPELAVYHATKAYVVSFSEALSEELKDTGVTVTCLCPGPTATDFFTKADMEKTNVVREADKTMMSASQVAKIGYDALMSGDRVVVAGAKNKILTFTRRVIPISLQSKIQKKFYESSEE